MKKNGEREEDQKCDVSEILNTFGKYQVIQYSLICLSTMCICMISINYVFVAGDLDYRCRVIECEDENSNSISRIISTCRALKWYRKICMPFVELLETSSTITYSMELYPTSVRGTLLGLGAFGARLATMISTITPILNTILEGLSTIFFGGLAIISSALLTLAPETKHLPLFDTIEQLETFSNDNKKKSKDPATTERYIDTGDNNA